MIFAGLDPLSVSALVVASMFGSFLTVALGIGGGVLVLALMASILPPAALIPVHAVVQLGSNASRAALLLRDVHWPPLLGFAAGSLVGVGLGGMIAVQLPPGLVQTAIGFFIIYSVLTKPPAWLSRWPALTGAITSFLTMFFGATGTFVANYVKSLDLSRMPHVATQATLMTLQHGLKIAAFGILGFAFAPWVGLIGAMICAGFIGTLVGRRVLMRMNDLMFRRVLNVLLILLSARLIWQGTVSLL